MGLLKQCVGIDIAKETFCACIGTIDQDLCITYIDEQLFRNNEGGFQLFEQWVEQNKSSRLPLFYVMEATGVYYENLAYHIHDNGGNLSVIPPSKAKHFAQSLSVKSKTDKIDAKTLTQLGLERRLRRWEVVSPNIRKIKTLCREYRNNKQDITKLKCRKHAQSSSYKPLNQIVKRLEDKIQMLTNHCNDIVAELSLIVKSDKVLCDKFAKMASAPGLGFITIACIVGETNGFAAIENGKQLVSYAGLDVVHKESGQRKHKTRISKRGNKYLRLAVYMPSLAATQYNPDLALFYNNLWPRKSAKQVGLVAVSRKLLLLAYTLWKKDEYYQQQVKVA